MLKRLLKWGALFLIGLLLAGSAGLVWLYADYQRFLQQPLALDESVLLHVAPGDSLRRVARDLQQRGLIDRPDYLIWHARHHDLATRIRAGEYQLTPGMTPQALLEKMVRGQVVQYGLTVIEGWTFRQMLAAVHAHPQIVPTLEGQSDEAIMAAIDRPGHHPEGLFLPDTYLFPRGTTDLDFLRRANRALEQVLEREWAAADTDALPLQAPYEALILASIIERETGHVDERERVAGVFVRRLQRGMRLQTDPTVIYGLGPDFEGRLRTRHLRTDTPYNTYTRHGLPPTPIALPGRASIRAALNPVDGDELFFVSRGDGSHHFSATYAEHRRAVRRYILGQE